MQLIKEDLWELIDSEDLNLNDAKIKKRDQRALTTIYLSRFDTTTLRTGSRLCDCKRSMG